MEEKESYVCEIQKLKELNSVLDADKQRAAELGLQLSQENRHLKERLEDARKETSKAFEDLVQENFSLKSKLSAKDKLEQEYELELESLQASLKAKDGEINNVKETEKKHYDGLRAKLLACEKELGMVKCNLETEQVEKEAIRKELAKSRRKSRLSDDSLRSSPWNNSKESARLELIKVTEAKESLECKVEELTLHLKEVKTERVELESQLREAREENENMASLLREYKTSLDEKTGEMQALQCELDSQKLLSANPTKKGNSMFSELDDQRIKIEAQLLKVAREKEQYELRSEELQKEVTSLKRQVTTALQLSHAGKANVDQLHALEDENQRLRGELRVSKAQVNKLQLSLRSSTFGLEEELSGTERSRNSRRQGSGKTSSRSSERGLVGGNEMLRDVVEQLQKEKRKLEEEVEQRGMERATVQDELIQERRLKCSLQQELEKAKNENLKLRLDMEKKQLAHGDKVSGKENKKQRFREKIPDAQPCGSISSRTNSRSSGTVTGTQDSTCSLDASSGSLEQPMATSMAMANVSSSSSQNSGVTYVTTQTSTPQPPVFSESDVEQAQLKNDGGGEGEGENIKSRLEPRKHVHISPEVQLISESGTFEAGEVKEDKENSKPTEGAIGRPKNKGKKSYKFGSEPATAEMDLDSSVNECKNQ